jgi:hypothetical protein
MTLEHLKCLSPNASLSGYAGSLVILLKRFPNLSDGSEVDHEKKGDSVEITGLHFQKGNKIFR